MKPSEVSNPHHLTRFQHRIILRLVETFSGECVVVPNPTQPKPNNTKAVLKTEPDNNQEDTLKRFNSRGGTDVWYAAAVISNPRARVTGRCLPVKPLGIERWLWLWLETCHIEISAK